jgi:hypothetical protein
VLFCFPFLFSFSRSDRFLFSAFLQIRGFQNSNRVISPEMLGNIRETVVKGFLLLSAWAARIKEQAAWKYSEPCSEQKYRSLGGKGGLSKEYEYVVRYNYSAEELEILIEVIGLLKGSVSIHVSDMSSYCLICVLAFFFV